MVIDGQDFIGRVTTAGAVTLIPVSSLSTHAPLDVSSLAAGADGSLWFTQELAEKPFGRISQSGVVKTFTITDHWLGNVANGPNGSIIVTGHNSKGQYEAFRVSATGAVTRYKIPAAISNAFQTYLGQADGSLWFTDAVSTPLKIGRITARGVATSHNLSQFVRARQNGIGSMALGQDGNDVYLLDNIGGVFSGITVDRPTATVYLPLTEQARSGPADPADPYQGSLDSRSWRSSRRPRSRVEDDLAVPVMDYLAPRRGRDLYSSSRRSPRGSERHTASAPRMSSTTPSMSGGRTGPSATAKPSRPVSSNGTDNWNKARDAARPYRSSTSGSGEVYAVGRMA